MALQIKTNVTALQAQKQLNMNNTTLESSMEKLASGQRINRSADDAAGLAISERMRAKIRSLDVAKRNASDAVSYIQTAEGALNELSNLTVRMRELTSQAASDTLGNRERSFLNSEFQQLKHEISRVIDSTEYNGNKLLSAEGVEKPLQIFVGSSNRGLNLDGSAPDFGEKDPDVLNIDLSELKAFNEVAANLTEDSVAIIPESLEGGATELGPEGTLDLMTRLDTFQNSVSSYRATLGSLQARLNSTISNIEVSHENLSAARSRIVDVDYAQETARFTQSKILTQAGLAVQAQANTVPEMILGLIR